MTLSCSVELDDTNGYDAINYLRWYINGDRYDRTVEEYEYSSDNVTSLLVIDSMESSDSGSYYCVVQYNDSANLYAESRVGYLTYHGTYALQILAAT